MKGRVVEKNEQFLVLKAGEDSDAVKTTIYLEDINKVETDEEYSNETKFYPTAFPQASVSRPWDAKAVLIEPKPLAVDINKDQAEYIKGLIKRSDRTLPEPDAADGLPVFNVASIGKGSISGFVKLPEEIATYKGPLYVYLAINIDGNFAITPGLPYQKIEPDAITSSLVHYNIENVREGAYKVFADWDIVGPPIEKKKIKGDDVLFGFGSKGDYTGSYEDIVKLDADESRDNVNIDCQTYITEGFVDMSQAPKITDFKLIDIYFKKISSKQSILVLRVKNSGDTAIPSLALDTFINDERVGNEPYVLGDLALDEEKEFDITALMAKGVDKKLFGTLRYKFVRPNTGEVELEKDVYLPGSNTD